MNVPDNLLYMKSHEWIDLEVSPATVGISDHAQEELTDLVYVELPEVGREVQAGEPVAVVESVKSANDIYAPVPGKVIEVNESLVNDPALANTDPYGEGWLFKMEVEHASVDEGLLSPEDYRELIGD